MATTWTLTLDCQNARAQAAFWMGAIGYVAAPAPEGFDTWEAWLRHFGVPEAEWDDGAALIDPDGLGPQLSFLNVPEPKVAKNRLHLDVQAGGGRHTPPEVRIQRITAAVGRLVGLGATVIDEHHAHGHLDHVVLADPEGNEFCVV